MCTAVIPHWSESLPVVLLVLIERLHKQQKSFGWSEYFSYPCWKQASLMWNCLLHIPCFDHFDWFRWNIWHWVSLSKMNVDDVCQGSLSFCSYWHSHNLLLAASLLAHSHFTHAQRLFKVYNTIHYRNALNWKTSPACKKVDTHYLQTWIQVS